MKRRFTGVQSGYRAARKVWRCKGCMSKITRNPHIAPHSHKNPAQCTVCKARIGWYYSASKSEDRRFMQLYDRQSAGLISNLIHPPARPFALYSESLHDKSGKAVVRFYTPDFTYEERDESGQWVTVYEDHKGSDEIPSLTKFIWSLVYHQYGVSIRVSYYKRDRIVLAEAA